MISPFITGDFVDGVGADCFLMAFANHMVAFIDRVAKYFTDYRTAPQIVTNLRFHRGLDLGNGDFVVEHYTFRSASFRTHLSPD